MTLEEMQRRKREFGYSNEKLAELSGVPLGTVQKVMSGNERKYEEPQTGNFRSAGQGPEQTNGSAGPVSG